MNHTPPITTFGPGSDSPVTNQDDEKRVIVLLELLGKMNKVRVARDWVAKAA